MEKLIIITPSYNRKHTISKLYKSLLKQNNKEFTWLIIDDGSNDGTETYVNELIKESKIDIEYFYKENGGKGAALNLAFEKIDGNSFGLIVDSDDFLLPNGVEIVHEHIERYDRQSNGAIFFHYQFNDGKKLRGHKKPLEKIRSLDIYSYNEEYGKHDGCIGYFGRAIKRYQFPIFEDEKYIGPTTIQMAMAPEFKIVYTPKVIGVAEYQETGLTKTGRVLRLKNPLSMIYYSGLLQSRLAPFRIRVKNSIGAQAYRFFYGKNNKLLIEYNLSKYLKKWAVIPGFLLKCYWQIRYRKWEEINVKK